MQHLLYLFLFMLAAASAAAQPKNCDQVLHYGDTTVCQNFSGKKHRLYQERFYVHDQRIFTRWWRYYKDGTYGWMQKRKKSAFAKADGPAVAYYADGTVHSVVHFNNGTRVKDCLEYYPSGAIKLRCYHDAEGEKDGIRTSYYENGQVESKARWQNGLLRDILEFKDEQGHDLAIGSFQQGTGNWIWYKNGQPAFRYPYQNGREGKMQKITSNASLK